MRRYSELPQRLLISEQLLLGFVKDEVLIERRDLQLSEYLLLEIFESFRGRNDDFFVLPPFARTSGGGGGGGGARTERRGKTESGKNLQARKGETGKAS